MSNKTSTRPSGRRLLLVRLIGGSTLLPLSAMTSWHKPIIRQALLPAHAVHSGGDNVTPTSPSPTPTPTSTPDPNIILTCNPNPNIVCFRDRRFSIILLVNHNIDTNNDGTILIAEAAAYTGQITATRADIVSLRGIEEFVALRELNCHLNNLRELDVSKNTALTRLSCGGNELTRLDLSQNTALTSVFCGANNLSVLDVSKNTELTRLFCSNNNLTRLDLSKNTKLTELDATNNPSLRQIVVVDTADTSGWMKDQGAEYVVVSG